jgi:hypothetical protein
MIKSESTERMKKMSAGVHSDRTLLMIPSIKDVYILYIYCIYRINIVYI